MGEDKIKWRVAGTNTRDLRSKGYHASIFQTQRSLCMSLAGLEAWWDAMSEETYEWMHWESGNKFKASRERKVIKAIRVIMDFVIANGRGLILTQSLSHNLSPVAITTVSLTSVSLDHTGSLISPYRTSLSHSLSHQFLLSKHMPSQPHLADSQFLDIIQLSGRRH